MTSLDLRTAGLVYLATPYSKYPEGLPAAHDAACVLAGRLIKSGVDVFCPIAHTHNIALLAGINPLDHAIWLRLDEAMMAACAILCVAEMRSWQRSYGIAKEIEWFTARSKPVVYLDPDSLRVSTTPLVSALDEVPVS
jgi:hypothetical protein